jgi:hypothetical protein
VGSNGSLFSLGKTRDDGTKSEQVRIEHCKFEHVKRLALTSSDMVMQVVNTTKYQSKKKYSLADLLLKEFAVVHKLNSLFQLWKLNTHLLQII